MILEKGDAVNKVLMIPPCVPYAMPQDPHEPEENASDPFAALGLPRRFDLEDAEIETAFLFRIARAHPDLHHPGLDHSGLDHSGPDHSSPDHPDPVRGDPTAGAAALTDARAVLTDPERRARALVRLLDPPAPSGPALADKLPDGFLMEMMELREQIEDELQAEAASEDSAARARWEAFAEERRQGHIARFAALADRLTDPAANRPATNKPATNKPATDNPATPDPAVLSEARAELNAWRYTERLIEQLDPAAAGRQSTDRAE